MKAVILAGGLGTRISEETHLKPKPMIEIGGMPILWHIMKIYSSHGINEFIICCGYKGYQIKEYFSNYTLHCSDITLDLASGRSEIHTQTAEPWKVTLVDTGLNTMTGGRLKRVSKYLDPEPFCFTYGDGLSDINITELIEFHNSHSGEATLTAVQPPGRYGSLSINNKATVESFLEKPAGDGSWINGGFFVLEPSVVERINGDSTHWEQEPLTGLAADRELHAYHHKGFWQPMDTLRDRKVLEVWSSVCQWKCW